jgi:hypothetical protein
MPHSTSPIGTDIQDGGYGLPRIPIPRTPMNKGKKGQGMEALALKTSAIAEQTVDTCPS